MKKTLLLTLTALLMITSFSCKKDSDDNTTPPAAPGFSAKVDGTTWTASVYGAIRSVTANSIQITTSNAAGLELMNLVIKGSGTGTYPIGIENIGTYTTSSNVFSSMFSDTYTGKIIITRYDESAKQISGTFFFDGADLQGGVRHITEGTFSNVSLTVY